MKNGKAGVEKVMEFEVTKGQGVVIEIEKIGNGTMEDPFRPNTTHAAWGLREDTGSGTYIIESFDELYKDFLNG